MHKDERVASGQISQQFFKILEIPFQDQLLCICRDFVWLIACNYRQRVVIKTVRSHRVIMLTSMYIDKACHLVKTLALLNGISHRGIKSCAKNG